MKKILVAALLASSSLLAGIVGVPTPTATELIATGGEVVIYFEGESASFDSELNLISPVSIGPFFHNHLTAPGTALSLGVFAAGDVLRFRMDVLSTGDSFFTGPGAGNPDGIVHVAHAGWAADGFIPVSGVWVGFEDIFDGGDFDYNDNRFVFTNVKSEAVPEPSTWAMIAGSLSLLGLVRRKRNS